MSFAFENLYATQPAEFIPHKGVKEGEGLQLELNLDIITLDWIAETEAFFKRWLNEQGLMPEIAGKPLVATETQKSKNGRSKKQSAADQADAKNEESVKNELELEFFANIKLDMRLKAMMLGGRPGETDPAKRIIVSWNMTQKVSAESNEREPKPISYETFSGMSQPLIEKLYKFCTVEMSEVKKKKETQSKSGS